MDSDSPTPRGRNSFAETCGSDVPPSPQGTSSVGSPSPLPPPPAPAWMWKPRSKLLGSDHHLQYVASLLQLRRIGATRWHRRFLFLDDHHICYGKDKNRGGKQIPFELIEEVLREGPDAIKRAHLPQQYAGFGWYLAVRGRVLHFCAESEESVAQWVAYLAALLRIMRGTAASIPPTSATLAACQSSEFSPSKQRAENVQRLLAVSDTVGEEETPHRSVHSQTFAPEDSSAATAALNCEDLADGDDDRITEDGPQYASCEPTTRSAHDHRGSALQMERLGQANPTMDPSEVTHSVHEANLSLKEGDAAEPSKTRDSISGGGRARSMGSADDESASDALLDVSSEDTEGDLNENDEATLPRPKLDLATSGKGEAGVPEGPVACDGSQHNGAAQPLPRELRYASFLLPLASEPHSHIGYRIPVLAPFFKSGDDASRVVFSRAMEKVGKRDNAQPREVVLTTRHLYLFSRSRLGYGHQLRCIDTSDITGVVESTTDAALVAVLIPAFHDILLRVVPQNSRVPGTEVDVKRQLLAHLYKVHCDVHTDHRFLFRESANVAAVVRRTVDARHPPIVVQAGDQMRVGELPALSHIFAQHADEEVYWSSIVQQVQEDRKTRLQAIAITEGSLYTLSETLQGVMRRINMNDLLSVEYDRDAQSVLLKGREVDLLFSVPSHTEFNALLQQLPAAMANGFGRTLPLTPSKQLHSHARLFPLSELRGGDARNAAVRRQRGFRWPKIVRAGELAAGSPALRSSADAAPSDVGDGAHLSAHSRNVHSTRAIRLFCSQFRFVEEVLQDYDDVVEVLRRYEAEVAGVRWDSLRLRGTLFTSRRVGDICLSAVCRLLDAKERATLAKPVSMTLDAAAVADTGTVRVVCVTAEGFLFLRHGIAASAAAPVAVSNMVASAGSVDTPREGSHAARQSAHDGARARLSVVVDHASSRGAAKDDNLVMELVEWRSVAALVRCHRLEGSSVALLTNRSHPTDYLFTLQNAEVMLDVEAAAIGSYARSQQSSSGHRRLLPVFAAPRAQNLAVALKKTVYDPFPTVALRYTARSFPSDRLRMAFIPDVADVCRRFGDNTIFFSGLAWRVRSATLRKCNGGLDKDPATDMGRQNNHLYKSFLLIVTNVALYHCTKGGLEMVRRTLLTDIAHITIGQYDVDTVLLSVPSEYDMYFRVEGRGAELVERLQEAYAEWTNYGHYLPFEKQGSHRLEDYVLPVQRVPVVAVHGTLVKPPHFNDLQSSRSAVECQRRTQEWHLHRLRRAIVAMLRVQGAATGDRRGSSTRTSAMNVTWEVLRYALAERQSYLFFVQRRCFRFGLTSETFEGMQKAEKLLERYADMVAAALALMQATRSGDLEGFQEALQRASAMPELRLLVQQEVSLHKLYCAQHECVTTLLALLRRYRYRSGGSVSIAALEAALLDLFEEARRLGLSETFLQHAVHVVRILTQRTQLQRAVSDPTHQSRLCGVEDGGWVLVQQAARHVGMAWAPPFHSFHQIGKAPLLRLLTRVAQSALHKAVTYGDLALVRGATALALRVLKVSDVGGQRNNGDNASAATAGEEHAAAVQSLRRSIDVVRRGYLDRAEQQKHFERDMQALFLSRQVHQRQQTWTSELLASMLSQCARLETQAATERLLASSGVQAVLAMERTLLTEAQYRLDCLRSLAQQEDRAQRMADQQLQRQGAMQARRRRKSVTSWRSQVDEVVSNVEAMLADDTTETEEGLRQGILRCVQLQQWIQRATASSGLSAGSGERLSSVDDLVVEEEDTTVAELVARLQTTASRASRRLSLAEKRLPTDDEGAPFETEATGAAVGPSLLSADGVQTPAMVTLPSEVEDCIKALDAAGLADCLRKYGSDTTAGTPAVLELIRKSWHAACWQRSWVRTLHRGFRAAGVLRSRELLERELKRADEAAYTDDLVEKARAVVKMLQRVKIGTLEQRDATFPSPAAASDVDAADVEAGGGEARRVSSQHTEENTDGIAWVEAPTAEVERETSMGAAQERGGRPAADASTVAACSPAPMHPALQRVSGAVEALTRVADLSPRAPLASDGPSVLRRLAAAFHDLSQNAARTSLASLSTSIAGQPHQEVAALHVESTCPLCGVFLNAWRAVWQHRLQPSGVFFVTPRSVWDLVRAIGEGNVDGECTAPYVARLSRDFEKLYRSTGSDAAARHRTDTVLLSLMFFTHRMTCVVDGLVKLGEEGRRDLLFPDAVLTQSASLHALRLAALTCDTLQWDFASVQALAVQCLTSTAPMKKISTPPLSSQRPAPLTKETSLVSMVPVTHERAQFFSGAAGVDEPVLTSQVSTRHDAPSVVARGESLVEIRDSITQQLHAGAQDVAFYLTKQLRYEMQRNPAALFDEHLFPEVGQLFNLSVLPPVLRVVTSGLVGHQQRGPANGLWRALTEMREARPSYSRSLAELEVRSIIELVLAITDTADSRSRYASTLPRLSEAELDAVRARMFLRECVNRHQLFSFIEAVFPAPLRSSNRGTGADSGIFGTLCDPSRCVLAPSHEGDAAQLRTVLQRISALPLVLIVDQELRS